MVMQGEYVDMAFAARFAQTCVICRKRIEPGDYIELTSERKGRDG